MKEGNDETRKPPRDASDPKVVRPPNTYVGKFVSMTGVKLVMANKKGKEHAHTLDKDAKFTCDGTVCKPEDLKIGNKIRVTTMTDDRNVAIGVEFRQ